MQDQVFTIRIKGVQVWKVALNGEVLPVEWPDKGSAQAGLETERRRAAAKGKDNHE